MIRPGVISSGLLVGSFLALSLPLSAQSSAQPAVGAPTLTTMGADCPVDLQAQRRGTGMMVETKEHSVKSVRQRLRLDWANRLPKKIVAAALVVHGFDASLRLIPAGSHASPALKKVVAVKLDLAREGHASTELELQHFATVSFIELKSIEYADGTRWSGPVEGGCRITPNLLLLVNAATR
jgi:hypothetical protein